MIQTDKSTGLLMKQEVENNREKDVTSKRRVKYSHKTLHTLRTFFHFPFSHYLVEYVPQRDRIRKNPWGRQHLHS